MLFAPLRRILGLRLRLLLCLLLFVTIGLLLLWAEESQLGLVANFYGNLFFRTLHLPVTARRNALSCPVNISVVVVVDLPSHWGRLASSEYQFAHRTLACYCALHGYPLEVLDLSRPNDPLGDQCPQTGDFMFRRHCALARFLADRPDVEFALFLDADMGVINPNHLLEEYLAPEQRDFDLIFYERIFNGEIMAGSYFVRNSDFGIAFLHFWADFYFRLPLSFHGTDNGAIHAVFLELFCGPKCGRQSEKCFLLWNASLGFDSLAFFSQCARQVLGSRNVFYSAPDGPISASGSVLLLTDFQTYWARDGWLTGNSWSPRDFILHGWQKHRLDRPGFARWHSPLVIPPEESNSPLLFSRNCADPKWGSENWVYKDTFLREEENIWSRLERIVGRRRADQNGIT